MCEDEDDFCEVEGGFNSRDEGSPETDVDPVIDGMCLNVNHNNIL